MGALGGQKADITLIETQSVNMFPILMPIQRWFIQQMLAMLKLFG